MKLIFSETKPDYGHYVFPYAVWALPEKGEKTEDLFQAGFLPSSRDLDRFYLCRHVRIRLQDFRLSSENRRILRKGDGITSEILPKSEYDFTDRTRRAWKEFADIRFGKDVMSSERLDNLMHGRIVTHLMVFRDEENRREVGTATLFIEPPAMAYYYYAFYDLNYYKRNLGMYMMTSAVNHFAQEGLHHLYLGTVYSKSALYKTQFSGAEFFNGFTWSDQIGQLKQILKRDSQAHHQHLLECEDFVATFYPDGLPDIASLSHFSVSVPQP